jgi:CheY-like chemotaxis protein
MSDQAVILLADDREDDVLLIRRAFAKTTIQHTLYVVQNGEDAISYLEGIGRFANRAEYPLPNLFLLDLKMPGVDGFDVLRWIKKHPQLSSLRIVVLTSSDAIHDVNHAYELGANSFMVKPFDFENTIELARVVTNYWLGKSKAPEVSRSPNRKSEKGQNQQS